MAEKDCLIKLPYQYQIFSGIGAKVHYAGH